jgi:hypothetical protein
MHRQTTRRAQFSIELLAAMAAYFALLAALISAQNAAGAGLGEAASGAADRQAASSACLFLDFFSADGRNTAATLWDQPNLSTAGRTVFVGAGNSTCLSRIAAGGAVRVEQNEREPA